MYTKTMTNNNINISCVIYIMALVSTFKPKYNVPELWINPLNGGNFFMYTKNYNKYTKVTISPTALPETPHKALSPIAIVLFVPVAEPKALLPITILGS